MIDRLREQIQERLDQLLGEADRLRKALAALDPRPSKPPARKPPARNTAAATETKPAASTTKRTAARRASRPAARSPRRTAPGATKASVLAALDGGEPMTAGQVADKTGLARPTVSTTLSKLAKRGEVEKAERGYRLPSSPSLRLPRRTRSAPVRRPVHASRAALTWPGGSARLQVRRRRRRDWWRRPPEQLSPGRGQRSDRRGPHPRRRGASRRCCPRECPSCRPPFETLLTHQLEHSLEVLVR